MHNNYKFENDNEKYMGQLTSNNDNAWYKVLGIWTVDDITLSQGKGNTLRMEEKGLIAW